VGGEAVPQRVDGGVLAQARVATGPPAGALHGGDAQGLRRVAAGEQPGPGPSHLPVQAERPQRLRRPDHVAVPATLALADRDHHALTADVRDARGHDLRDPEPGGIGGPEEGAALQAGDGAEDAPDLVGAEDHRQALLGLGVAERARVPVAAEADAVEEAQGRDGLVEVTPGDVSLLGEVQQVGADLGHAEVLGRGAEVAGEEGDALDVGGDGARGEAAQGHVLDEATAQRRQDGLLAEGAKRDDAPMMSHREPRGARGTARSSDQGSGARTVGRGGRRGR
jgi:hypothetical protein